MNKKGIHAVLAILAAATFGAWFAMGRPQQEAQRAPGPSPQEASTAWRQAMEATRPAGGSGAVATPEAAAASQAQAPDAHMAQVAQRYRERKESIANLIQRALTSRDPVELEFAKAYVQRCVRVDMMMLRGANGGGAKSPAMLVAIDTPLARARDALIRFCGDIGSATADQNIHWALDQGMKEVNAKAPGGDLANAQGLRAAMALQSADLLMSRFDSASREERRRFLIDIGVLGPEDLDKWRYAEIQMAKALTIATCHRWGCDEEVLNLNLCDRHGQCGNESLEEKYRLIEEADRARSGWTGFDRNMLSWAEVLRRGTRFLQWTPGE